MKKKEEKTFKITHFEPRTLAWWRMRRDQIDMNPPYQRRGRLWSTTDKAYLIDSIINGYDIPKFYLADFSWGDSPLNEKKLPYAIIDGKQRFEAIFDFFDNRLTLNEGFIYLADPTLNLANLGYKDLKKSHPEVAEEFENGHIDVISVFAKKEEDICELFVRLNRSKALTGAEVRNAMAGPGPEVIREICKNVIFTDYIAFNVKRGQDLNAANKILMFEYNNGLTETKKRNLDLFVKTLGNSSQPEKLELSFRRVLDVLADMSEVFLPRDRLLRSSGVFPVYFWFIRNENPSNYHHVREFLLYFEELRKRNRDLKSTDPKNKNVEKELEDYDKYNRSTNDKRSHEKRYEILKKWFDEYI